ncbi:MAG TPA: DUF4834 family protein [Salegentibacter sp.]|nr:DUF4834 family protein [Salegentibacter sp.]
MLEASFTAVLKTILIILLVYFGFKILIRWFGPLILKYFMRKVGKKFEQQFNQQEPFSSHKKEPKVKVDKTSVKNPKSNKKVGEYIDYEEID